MEKIYVLRVREQVNVTEQLEMSELEFRAELSLVRE